MRVIQKLKQTIKLFRNIPNNKGSREA